MSDRTFIHILSLRKIRALALSWLICLFFSTGVYSKEQDELEQLLKLSLKDLFEVEVTSSTLTSMELKTAPSAITVFTQKQIRNLGVDYLYELINFAPGFQTFRQGANSIQHYHSARGHRSSASSREVLILIDGIRINREFDNASAIPMISLHNVEKVEFIRGPGSALYGSNAFLGVIDIKTNKQMNVMQLSVGEANRKQLSATGSQHLADWRFSSAVNVFDEDGVNYELENNETLEPVQGKDPREGQDIQFSVSHGDTVIDGMYFRRIAGDYYVTDRTSSEVNRNVYRNASLRLQHGFTLNGAITSTISAIYSNNYIFRRSHNSLLGGTENSYQEENNIDIKFHNLWQYHSDGKMVFGLTARHSEFDPFTLDSPALDAEIYAKSERDITGIYLQNQSEFHNGMQLTLGGRFDHYNQIGSQFSPRLGLIYPAGENQMFKLLYGEAFRVPTVNELTLDPPGGFLVGNSELRPETIRTWELIWLGQWDDHSFGISTYYNSLDSAIYRESSGSTSSFANQVDVESFYGFEVEYSHQLFSSFIVSGNASVMQDLPASDFRQADRLASLIFNYQHDYWNLNLNFTYAGARETLAAGNPLKLDDYILMNVNWMYSVNRGVTVFVHGKNILGEEYFTPSQSSIHTVAMPNRGRELSIGVKMNIN